MKNKGINKVQFIDGKIRMTNIRNREKKVTWTFLKTGKGSWKFLRYVSLLPKLTYLLSFFSVWSIISININIWLGWHRLDHFMITYSCVIYNMYDWSSFMLCTNNSLILRERLSLCHTAFSKHKSSYLSPQKEYK